MSEEKKVKQTTVRYFEDDLSTIADLAKQLDVSQAELISIWRKSYERLKLEENSSQGENLKTLRAYTDKIVTLFTSMAEATEENVLNEQNKAIDAEKRYEEQIVKTNKVKTESEDKIKEQDKEIKRLQKELDKYKAFEETIEGRISDKDQIIQSKDTNILSLTEELTELRTENKELQKTKEKEADYLEKISALKEALKEKDFDKQQALLDLREELQAKHERRVQDILDKQSDKEDKIRNTMEERTRVEIARIREEHSKDITRIREEHAKEADKLQKEHEKETARIHKESSAALDRMRQEHANEIKALNKEKNK